jgi:hypothetical protein
VDLITLLSPDDDRASSADDINLSSTGKWPENNVC